MRALGPSHRADFHSADGVLLVWRMPPPPPPPEAMAGQPAAVPGDPSEGVEVLVALWDDGSVTALNGHVDLGTGIRTAFTQIVAEELDVPLSRVHMVLGSTGAVPNQGGTIASASIQNHSAPIRLAAAQARAWVVAQAATRLQVDPADLATAGGFVHVRQEPMRRLAYGELLQGLHVELELDPKTPVKPPSDYRVVGQAVGRVDIPAKAQGELTFVHDMRVPGMVHGRVVRPPYAGMDAGPFVGTSLLSVDEESVAHIPGVLAVVVQGDFVGVVAEREEHAEQAMHALKVQWKPWSGMPGLTDDLAGAISANPATRRLLMERGDVAQALADAAVPMPRTYVWPYQLHGSIGPSCALAVWKDAALVTGSAEESVPSPFDLTVWAGTQSPHVLRRDLATLFGLPDAAIDVVRMEAAGCYGRNCADDVAADAALLARAVKRPVRVQLTREQENAWDPKGAGQLMQVDGGLTADGQVAAYDFQTSYPSNGAPVLALLLTGAIAAESRAYEMGDRTAVPPYDYENMRVVANDMAPILRASWLRGVSALPNSFAHESYIDELAAEAGADPVAFRLAHLKDVRAAELLRATAERAAWTPHTAPQMRAPDGDWLKGQGVAYARYVHSRFPGFGAAWAAWVADVEVNQRSGEVHVSRVVVGHDAGLMINPAGVQHQIHGNVLQTTSRALKEQVTTDSRGQVANLEWGSYPILNFREVPVVEVMMMPRPDQPPLGAGESSSVPGTAAIANAIFDATGVRLRQPPFTPEVVKAAMDEARLRAGLEPLPPLQPALPGSPASGAGAGAGGVAGLLSGDADASLQGKADASLQGKADASLHGEADRTVDGRGGPEYAGRNASLPPVDEPQPARADDALQARLPRRRRGVWATGLAVATAAVGALAGLLGWRPAIAPVAVASSAEVYTAATIERGRQLAAVGDCAVCHTAPGGVTNAGGRAMETPFGTVFSTNITPDAQTGIGAWSFSAFQRAMREGISRDGHHLYPAFPYTAYTRVTDDDLTALYAYLMSQPAVPSRPPETKLAFPFNLRPLMAVWNAIYLDPGPVAAAEVARPSSDALPAAATRVTPAQAPAADPQWVRGEYLVNGLGHCAACHSPRDALGGEQLGARYLSGALIDGWEAPALTSLSRAPVPWSLDEFFRYLRFGHTQQHGVAGGPMADVVRSLAGVSDADVNAMATYLASLQQPAAEDGASTSTTAKAGAADQAATTAALAATSAGRMFQTACAACHHDGEGPVLLGRNAPLTLNTNLHSDRPDNVLRTILEGVREPASPELGFMPSFRHALSDQQIAELAAYMRSRFAPDKPAWAGLASEVARVRAAVAH